MFKKLLKYMEGFWPYAILCPIFMMLEVLTDVFVPRLMAQIVDVAIPTGIREEVIRYGLYMVGLALFGFIMGTTSSYLGAKAGMGLGYNLRSDVFKKVQTFSFKNLDRFGVPSLITRLTTDIDTISIVTMMTLRMAIRAPFMLIMALIMAIRVNRRLATIFIVALPVLAIAIFATLNNVRPKFLKIQEKLDDLNRITRENINGIRVVKSFNREEHEKDKFKRTNEDLRKSNINAMNTVIFLIPIMTLVIYLCIIAALWLGGNQILEGGLGTGDLISFITYISQVLTSLMMLSIYFMELTRAQASAKREFEVLEADVDIESPDHAINEVKSGSIQFNDVSFTYDGSTTNVLSNIDFRINSGETVGIIGPTGSSKSTLVELIPRLYDVTRGSVEVGGVDVKDYELEVLRDSIGFVLQKNTLFTGTIRSNMLWGNENATDEDIIAALKNAQAWEFVSKFDDLLDHEVEQGGANFSGGQKQRLCIARVLVKNPKIIIMDDSTSAVDTKTDMELRESFEKNLKDTTTIIIAQRVSSIKDCDRIILLDDGKVEAMGSHEDLLENSRTYKEINQSQEGVLAE